MKHWIILACVVLSGVASVVVSERAKVDVSANPAAVLHLVGDTERELTRMPVRFTRMPDEDEIRIGNELAKSYSHVQEADKADENKIVQEYVMRVGAQLAAHAHRQLPYKFHYIASPSFFNAFAAPGGHIYVGGGLLSLMDSEDELAAVIGHEIEHVDHYHCAERVQQQEALRKIPLGELLALPIEVFEAGYSKEQELEADREGTRLAVEAGYAASGAVRLFETFDRLQKEYQAQARTPQEEVSQVARQTVEGYFRSHPPTSERIAQVQKLIANEAWAARPEAWTARPERDLEVAYIFWTAKAQAALDAREYGKAEQLANRSLRLRPQQPKALEILARAQFARAEFSEAAAAYRKLLEAKPLNLQTAAYYAQALAAWDRRRASLEFGRWAEGLIGQRPREIDVMEAGLALLEGDPRAARRLEPQLLESREALAPIWMGELGSWHYLAGNYEKSVQLLSAAVQQRPQELMLRLRLAWAQIELRHYRDVLTMLSQTEVAWNVVYKEHLRPEDAMIRAVAEWQAQDRDEAMRDFQIALVGRPEWGNAAWVKALYSPLVAQCVQEMQAESERRKQKARVVANR